MIWISNFGQGENRKLISTWFHSPQGERWREPMSEMFDNEIELGNTLQG